MKNKTTAGIFALLLGGFGIHKFYLGKVGMGILYLVFCWAIIPWIVGFIEGIILLSMDQIKFDMKYNNYQPVVSKPQNSTGRSLEELRDIQKEIYQKGEVHIKTEKEILNADYQAGKITREEYRAQLAYWNAEEAEFKQNKKDNLS